MAEHTRRPKIGLALGGGGARGAAHVGVLRVLEEAAIPIDCIAGTSSGALVGAAYAAGLSVDEIERAFASVRMRDLFRPVWSRDGWFDNGPLAQSFQRAVGRHTVADLQMPFAAMATDAITGEAVVLDQGPLADLLRASTAIPCIVRPVVREGRRLIDGGVSHKVPVRLARSLGADLVIAVDLSHPYPWIGRLRHPIAYLMRVIEIMDEKLVAAELSEADVVIQPHLTCGSFQFKLYREQVERGAGAALQVLERIRQRLAGPAAAAAD